ncbi:MAG TPA: DUF262 domain-containing HNH endonuclease family protein [Thermoanaerobaculia bacterium]|nr:DUF262 domain-containing HNH endonuclease family protein [Thermoanaerobaculia bacterium]
MANAFSASPESIGVLLTALRRERIVVPPFQRGYMWQQKQVKQFWKDILRFQTRRSLPSAPRQYFLGPIVTLSKPDDRELLLDGQQRLATATILLSVIRDLAKNVGTDAGTALSREIQTQMIERSGGFSLEMGELDSLYFRETIQMDPSTNRKPAYRTNLNIKNARRTLYELVKEHIGVMNTPGSVNGLRALFQTIVSDLIMARIPVSTEGEAFQIFETLNDRGLKLQAPDLLLNYLMSIAPEEHRKDIRNYWTEMIQSLKQEDINKFLRHMWVSRYGDLKDDPLFDALKDHIEKHGSKSLDFAADCASDCEKYVEILSLDEERIGASVIGPLRRFVKDLDVESALPLLLACHSLLTRQDFEMVVRLLIVFYVQYSIISNLDRGDMAELFYSIARDVRAMVSDPSDKRSSRNCALAVKKSLMSNAPSLDEIKKRIPNLNFEEDASEARYFVGRIAECIQSPTKELALNEVNLEHVYPLNPEPDGWGGEANQELLNEYTWHLGNLTIYGSRINNKSRNKEFADKRKDYRTKSQVKMTADIGKGYANWNKDAIMGRAVKLTKKALEIWAFDNPSRV